VKTKFENCPQWIREMAVGTECSVLLGANEYVFNFNTGKKYKLRGGFTEIIQITRRK
jgi:hypothetical protein